MSALGDDQIFTPCYSQDGASCYDAYCEISDGSCSVTLDQECGVDKVYFVGLENENVNLPVTYTLTLTADLQQELLPIYLGVDNCFAITCEAYFQVLNTDGTPLVITPTSLYTVSSLSTSNSVSYFIYTSTSHVPSTVCDDGSLCSSDAECSVNGCFPTGDTELFVYILLPDCGDCDTLIVSISVSFDLAPVASSLALNTPSTASLSSYTLSSTLGQTVVYLPANAAVLTDSCDPVSCNILFPDPAASATYYFGPGVTLSTPSVNSLTTTPVTYTFDPSVGFLHFSYTPSATTRLESIEITNVNYCALDLQSGTLPFFIYQSFLSPPFSDCDSACGNDPDFALKFGACGSDYGSFVVSEDCYYGNYYFSICSSLSDFQCPVSFDVSVTETPITSIGTSHLESNFIHISAFDDPTLCPDTSLIYTYYTSDFLFAAVREVVGATVSLLVCPDAYCVTNENGYDNFSACGVSSECFDDSIGDTVITVAVVPNTGYEGFSFDLLVINQYIALSSPVQSTIGVLTHYYSYSATTIQSIVFQLTVLSGPSLNFFVFGESNAALNNVFGNAFSETVPCAFGDCYIYVPSQAKRSADTTFYITLASSTLATNSLPKSYVDSIFLDRNQASNAIKETSYELSVTVGTQNCISAASIASSAPFCSDVLNGISSSSLWSFADVASKDSEASCLFNSIADSLSCPQATSDCLDWVKTLACLITFPQCDSNGFQSGVCRSVCGLVDQYCGATWAYQADGYNADWITYACDTDFYVDSTNSSTCFPIPPPPPPPSSVEDYKPVSAGPAVLAPFDVPVFSDVTIYLTTGEFASSNGVIISSGGSSGNIGHSTITASELTSIFTPGAFNNSAPLIGLGFVVFLILVVL